MANFRTINVKAVGDKPRQIEIVKTGAAADPAKGVHMSLKLARAYLEVDIVNEVAHIRELARIALKTPDSELRVEQDDGKIIPPPKK